MPGLYEEGHTVTKAKTDITTMEKKGDKSTSDPNDDSLLVPMPDTMTESANEMKHSTCEDRGYEDIGSIDDSPLLDALANATTGSDPMRRVRVTLHAITPTGCGSTTRMRDSTDTTVAVRKYSKDGIAF
ncbi:hypothetical protein V6N13_069422 [Hibiscus sabdariffa]